MLSLCSLPVHLVCSWRKEIIILGYFNVWELLSGYRFVLFVVKVPEVLEA